MLRKLLGTLLFVVMVMPIIASPNVSEEVILVANAKAGSISVVDTKGFKTKCEIDVIPDSQERKSELSLLHRLINWYAEYKYADDIVLSPSKRILYVSRASIADVAAFDLKSGKLLWRVPVRGYRSDHMALSKDGRYLFVSAVTSSLVQVIDTEQRKVVAEIPTGSRPHGIKVSEDGSKVFIGEMKGNSLTIADTAQFKVETKLKFDEGVRPFDLTRDGRFVYLQLSNFHGFLEYDLKVNRTTRSISLPETARSREYRGNYPKDAAHHGLSLSTDEKTLCVVGTASNYVALVSRPELHTEVIIPVGEQPSWAIQSLDGEHCYVSSRGADSVSVISYKRKKEVARIPVGNYPQRMVTAKVPAVCGGGF